MNLSRGFQVSAIASILTLILFVVAPWVYNMVGPLNFGFATGLDLAKDRTMLFVIPAAALIALVLIYASTREWLSAQYVSVGLLVLGLVPAAYLLYGLGTLAQTFGPIQIGQLSWGLWGTLVTLVGIAVGGVVELVQPGWATT